MLKIFISHNFSGEDDLRTGELLEKTLRKRAYEVWRAKRNLKAGRHWITTIEDRIEWCQVMIVVWSEHSPGSYVDEERQAAQNAKKIIVTCWLHKDKVKLPLLLGNRQAIPFDDENKGLEELLSTLTEIEAELEDTTYRQGDPLLPDFIEIPAGTFQYSLSGKRENVDAFEFADFPVTIAQFERFARPNLLREWQREPENPVYNVSWDEAVKYCKWLSEKTGCLIRLPLELQWEYAARAGKELEYATINGKIRKGICNYNLIEEKPTPKEVFLPNAFELYDMSGNLWEWCEDEDPVLKDYRIVRGGSWIDPPENCRTTSRHSFHRSHGNLYTGFRVIRVKD